MQPQIDQLQRQVLVMRRWVVGLGIVVAILAIDGIRHVDRSEAQPAAPKSLMFTDGTKRVRVDANGLSITDGDAHVSVQAAKIMVAHKTKDFTTLTASKLLMLGTDTKASAELSLGDKQTRFSVRAGDRSVDLAATTMDVGSVVEVRSTATTAMIVAGNTRTSVDLRTKGGHNASIKSSDRSACVSLGDKTFNCHPDAKQAPPKP